MVLKWGGIQEQLAGEEREVEVGSWFQEEEEGTVVLED